MKTKMLDIILPAYHEEKNIEKVIRGIEKYVKTPHKITVVLQDKNDPTIAVLDKLSKTSRSLNFTFTKNGKGILKAFKEGFKQTNAPIITIMMSDLSDDPKDIDAMVKKIEEGYDLVCATRYSNSGKRIGGPKFKGFLSWLACLTLKYMTGVPTNDSTNAFKTFRRPLLNKIEFESQQGFEMPLELTMKAYHLGFKITETSTIWRDRTSGESQFELWKNIPYYLKWYFYGMRKNLMSKKLSKKILFKL
jgi:dolichol-phosphate mannosyltransferase